jgi:hypothetical protein
MSGVPSLLLSKKENSDALEGLGEFRALRFDSALIAQESVGAM